MIIFDYSNYNSLCVCGDIHGEFRTLMFNIKHLGIENSVIIVAGDCGIGFEKEVHYTQLYNKLSKTLEATIIYYCWLGVITTTQTILMERRLTLSE